MHCDSRYRGNRCDLSFGHRNPYQPVHGRQLDMGVRLTWTDAAALAMSLMPASEPDALLEAADALCQLHGVEPGTVSTATVAETVELLASLVAEARAEVVAP